MDNNIWQKRLDEASDPESVATICKEFLDTWRPEDLAGIVLDCRPPTSISAAQVVPYAIRLIAEIGVGNRATAPLLYAMSTFFTKAALRLAEITASAAPPAKRAHRSSGFSAT